MGKLAKILALIAVLLASGALVAHGGGLDKNGCHRNNKEGNYHCHRGPDAGKTYTSKEAYEKSKNK